MDYESGTLEKAEELEKNPAGVVRRWLLELKLADKREEEWRKKGHKVWDRYRQKEAKKNSYNILWANTETLRPAVYNSLPKPDVRRRYKDEDPIGKAVSDVLCRSLEYGLDTTDFDSQIRAVALDMLLPGRGVARVRYVPTLAQVGVDIVHEDEAEQHEAGGEALEGDNEELQWEQAPIEHVQWDDFRISTGKEWSEICWIAFRHRLTRDELEAQFGKEIGSAIQLDATDDDDIKAERDEKMQEAFKTAEVWEIWDKDKHSVIFISRGHKDKPLMTIDDPLNLNGFFPIPRPVYSIEDSSSLVPIPLFELYKEQADELDRITQRINVIVKGLKLRGIYDATITELSEVMRGEDNDLIPAQNVTALLERGGLEKAIWFLPIEQAAVVLRELYSQREQIKQVIYEITGISDIIRGSSVASETATAQQIKNQWGTMRLKRMQAEISRFVRDLIRLQAEIIAEKFHPETMMQMTGLKYPTEQDKQAMMLQAQQTGQQPQPLGPTWEEVIAVLRDDAQRTFKIDIETDSTVAASVESDMDSLQKLLGGIVQLVQGFGPAVQSGAVPIEAVKEIIMAVTRRAKLGSAVEDALDKIQQPQQQQPQQDNSLQIEQGRMQHEQQIKQAEMQQTGQLEQMKIQAQGQLEQQKAQISLQIEQMKAEQQASIEMQRLEFDKFKAQLEAETKVLVAQISAEAGAKQAQINAAMAQSDKEATEGNPESEAQTADALAVAIQGFTAALEQLRAPRTIVRGPDGRAMGIE